MAGYPERVVREHVLDGAYLGEDGNAVIDIGTLEQLLSFVKNCSCCEIVLTCRGNGFVIEDYDDYRE
jgi:hypothetical protein